MMFKYLVLAFLLAALVQGATEQIKLRETITQSLEEYLKAESQGIQNCENKCEKAYNRLAYQISAVDGRRTYEFQACVRGCNQCILDLANATTPRDNCFKMCKTFDWKSENIVKGVIEPDKACIGGCIINTCQVICEGGTVDPPTPSNKRFFYPNGGCSIKTEPYSQYFQYVPWNSPNVGQGGTEDVAACCANSWSLCDYVGDTASQNYIQLLSNTAQLCQSFVPSGTQADICEFFRNPQNCGSNVQLQ